MRNIFKFLMMGLMIIAFSAAAIPSVFAQPTEQETIYKRFTDNYKKPDAESQKVAIAAGDEFIQKFGAEADYKAQSDFINKVLPKLKAAVEGDVLFKRFNDAVPAKNWDEAFAGGKAILAKSPDNVDVMLVLASIGFDNAAANPPVSKYNTDTVNIAKTAIQKIEEGKPSGTGNFGAFDYVYKTTKYADGKNNALSWMNYTIGYIMFNRLNQKKEALPYLYKSTQIAGFYKDSPDAYALIGSYYVDEYNKIVSDRAAKIQANENKETPETRSALGVQYAYAERALNAYAVALKQANANPEVKPEYKTGLTKILNGLYKGRFEKDDGAAAYITQAGTTAFADPTSEVTPVAVEALPEPTTPTTTGSPTPTGSPTTTGTPAATTPAASPSPATAKPTPAAPKTSPSPTTPKPSPSASPKKP